MSDRELLEKAAKAAGVELVFSAMTETPRRLPDYELWNPLTDDGDALRLAVKCGINIDMDDQSAWIRRDGFFVQEYWGGDYPPCYRHAIVRAAASLGEKM